MRSFLQYTSDLFKGIRSLLTGLSVTWKELWTKKVTQQYPENRDTLEISDRFRAELVMPHDENNEHACTACGICQMNCPNGTRKVISKSIETEDGKKKKILVRYIYDLGMCTFCNLCVITCPQDAIIFANTFEIPMFPRSKLIEQLNHEGSKLREKKKESKPLVSKPVAKAEEAVHGDNKAPENIPQTPVEPIPAQDIKPAAEAEPVVKTDKKEKEDSDK